MKKSLVLFFLATLIGVPLAVAFVIGAVVGFVIAPFVVGVTSGWNTAGQFLDWFTGVMRRHNKEGVRRE